ncbi:MAG: CSLREA domain-containing protein, partial [Chloroflexota bacterium]
MFHRRPQGSGSGGSSARLALVAILVALLAQTLVQVAPVAASVIPSTPVGAAVPAPVADAPSWGAWTASGPGTVTTTSDGTTGPAAFGYSLSPAGFSTVTWSFTSTATQTGTLNLAWHYTGFHAYFAVTATAAVIVNGAVMTQVLAAGPQNCCTTPSGGFDYSGTVPVSVNAGDTFGFRVAGSNFDSNNVLNGHLEVTQADTAQAGPALVVNTTADHDDGICGTDDCTLREALVTANAIGGDGVENVSFAIPGGGLQTINPTSPLPAVTVPVAIDGRAAAGATCAAPGAGTPVPAVGLNGTGAGAGATGLTFAATSAGSSVSGLRITGFAGAGIAAGGGLAGASPDIFC